MPPDETIWHLLLGGAIGFVLGYLTCYLRDIKEELDEVKDELEHEVIPRVRDEKGFMRNPLLADFAVLLVVVISVFASFQSQKSSNESNRATAEVRATNARLVKQNKCTRDILSKALEALDVRTKYTVAQIQANLELQSAQAKFLGVVGHQPPLTEKDRQDAFIAYQHTLDKVNTISQKNANNLVSNPIPTKQELSRCLQTNKE